MVDLHVHTTASDGSLSPGQCVAEAARLGLAAIAVTDHDTLAGNAEAQAQGRELGVEVVPAVEVSARHERQVVHILGYYPAPEAGGLRALLARLQAARDERNPQILARLAELGCPVSDEEVAAEAGSDFIGRPHIAAVMVRKGYVAGFQDAFNRYLGEGALAYVERRKPTAADAIAALLAAHAVPVLAHPGTLGGVDATMARLVRFGLRGIEVYYHSHSPPQVAAYAELARRHGLIETGGTDFHGRSKPDIQMGFGRGNMRVPYRLLARLKEQHERLCPSTRSGHGEPVEP